MWCRAATDTSVALFFWTRVGGWLKVQQSENYITEIPVLQMRFHLHTRNTCTLRALGIIVLREPFLR
jgi:hypothetical protein